MINSKVIDFLYSKQTVPFECLVTSYINSSEWQNIMGGDTDAAENAEYDRNFEERCIDALRAFPTANNHRVQSDTSKAKSFAMWANSYVNSSTKSLSHEVTGRCVRS